MRDKHCSDEVLAALLDGELAPRAERSVRNHMAACWPCRTRAAELEEQIHRIARAMDEPVYPGPDWISESRMKFAESRRQFDQTFRPSPWKSILRPFANRAVQVAASVMLLVGVGTAWFYLSQSTPVPLQVIARARQEERQVFGKPVHISRRVDIVQIRPAARAHSSRLDVWSDARTKRFASRWSESDGTLKYAQWRPDSAQGFVYDTANRRAVAARIRPSGARSIVWDISAGGLGSEQIAKGFSRWLDAQRWQPVSFASDLALFVNDSGVILQAERMEIEGKTTLRLTARRRAGAVTAEVVLDLDPITYRPRMERLRFETSEQATEIRLTTEREEFPTAEITPAVFIPELPAPASERTVESLAPPTPPQIQTPDVQSSASRRAAIVMDSLMALHRLGACLGEPVDVVDDPKGVPVVRGVVRTSARKQELIAALERLAPDLKLEIETVDEAVASQKPVSRTPLQETAAQLSTLSNSRLPLEDQIREHFPSESIGNRTVDSMVAEFTRHAASEAAALFSEAWALRRLAERYGGNTALNLPPRLKAELESMLRDHAGLIAQRTAHLRGFLEPILLDAAAARATGSESVTSAAPATWVESALRDFQTAQEIHDRTQFLFAGAHYPSTVGSDPSTVAAELLRKLRMFEVSVRQTQNQVAGELASKP